MDYKPIHPPASVTLKICSWCHTAVPLGTKTCPDCGHRADLPRLKCDCLKCRITHPGFSSERG